MKFFFYRRAVFLNSELLEPGVTDDELIWAVGRFIGYLRTRREAGFWGWTIRAAEKLVIFNFFILPYERAMVLTGDRIALDIIGGNISSAVSAMQKMLVGRLLGYSVNPAGLVDQQRLVKGSLFAFLARMGKSFPHTTTRYVDLIDFARQAYPEQYARFEAENPGMPTDLPMLAALPGVPPSDARDPVWVPLLGALLIFSLCATGVVVAVKASRDSSTASPSSISNPGGQSFTAAPPAATASDSPSVSSVGADAVPAYTSSSGRFSVQFPSTPTKSSEPITLPDGSSVSLHVFSVEDSSVAYIVMYNDFPSSYIDDDRQTFLKEMVDAMAKGTDGTLDSDSAIDLNGDPGRSFSLTTGKGEKYTINFYLHGKRLYRVMAVGSPDPANMQQFLQSFQIL
jgi:hypothetical protein